MWRGLSVPRGEALDKAFSRIVSPKVPQPPKLGLRGQEHEPPHKR